MSEINKQKLSGACALKELLKGNVLVYAGNKAYPHAFVILGDGMLYKASSGGHYKKPSNNWKKCGNININNEYIVDKLEEC